jgi:hypothetical protein
MSENRDRANHARLETSQIEDVKSFLDQKSNQLETAELTVRRSAGTYIVQLRSTDEPSLS